MYSTSTFLLGTFTRILSSNNIVRQGRRKRKIKTETLKNRDRDNPRQMQIKSGDEEILLIFLLCKFVRISSFCSIMRQTTEAKGQKETKDRKS